MEEIKLNAHAKLNLSLEILGKRPDGYHDILSLMQGIGLCDALKIQKCPQNGTKYNMPHCTIEGHDVYLCTNTKTIPTDMNNLAFKGIDALMRAVKGVTRSENALKEDLVIELEKRLPVAAGIAGGSADAAAAMLGLNALLGYPLSLRELMDTGAAVGADVPFSLLMNARRNRASLPGLAGLDEASDAAWMTGTGDKVEPTEAVEYHVIMANPGVSVSTAKAYAAMDEIGYSEKITGDSRKLFVNDMEKYALANYPEIAEMKSMMSNKLEAYEVLMSGSGASVAAYYKDKGKAERDFAVMRDESASRTNWGVWLTTTGDA